MLAIKTRIRSNSKQIKILLDYMATHPSFANGEYRGASYSRRNFMEWEKLKRILKSHGPNKTIEQWKHTWRDLKKKAREEYNKYLHNKSCTGVEADINVMSPNSRRILKIIGVANLTEDETATSQLRTEELDVSVTYSQSGEAQEKCEIKDCIKNKQDENLPIQDKCEMNDQSSYHSSHTSPVPSPTNSPQPAQLYPNISMENIWMNHNDMKESEELQTKSNELLRTLCEQMEENNALQRNQIAVMENQNITVNNRLLRRLCRLLEENNQLKRQKLMQEQNSIFIRNNRKKFENVWWKI